MARSTARKRALNTLYEADEKGQEILSLLAERIDHPGAQTPLPDYAIEIIRGVDEHLKTIDYALNEYSPSWKVRRMAVVDRNILRIAVWEMRYNDEVPEKVAIDEAISLSKTLSDAESPSFIHGLLSAVNEHRTDIEEIQAEPLSADVESENTDAQTDIHPDADTKVDSDKVMESGTAVDGGQTQPLDAQSSNEIDQSAVDDSPAKGDESHSEMHAELKSEQGIVPDDSGSDASYTLENLEISVTPAEDDTTEHNELQG
jgi:N utilization substance protein B